MMQLYADPGSWDFIAFYEIFCRIAVEAVNIRLTTGSVVDQSH